MRRSAVMLIPHLARQEKHINHILLSTVLLVTIRQCSDLSLYCSERNQFLVPLSALHVDESYNFSCFSKLLLTVPSVYLNLGGALQSMREAIPLSLSQQMVPISSRCRWTQAFTSSGRTHLTARSSKENECDDD